MTHGLPPAWLETTVDQVFRKTGGGTPATGHSEFWGNGVPWITSADIDDAGDISPRKAVTQSGIASSATNPVPPGSVVVVTRVGLGKVALATQKLCFSQDCQALLFNPQLLDPTFVAHQIRRTVRGIRGRGTTIAGVTVKQLGALSFSLPPLPEQHRIVEAIDSYLTRLDDAVASLQRVQAKLKAYRASVLKAAVEGRLVSTEASLARAEKRDYEPAEVLMDRLLRKRRRRWEEAEIARLKATGKTPKDDKWRGKYKEPVAPDTSRLSELPDGWCWATVDMLANVKGGLTKGQRRSPKDLLLDVPYLRVANVQRGHLDLSEVKTIKATHAEIDELRLAAGDVLFNEGGDRDKLGRGWIWNDEIGTCIHQNHVFRARIFTTDYEPRLLSWYGNSSGQRYFFSEGKQTTNLASINMTKLKLLPVPIPPKNEQRRIVDEVERLLSVADDHAVAIAHDIKRCTRLKQAVLKWAFEGKLVDEDPNDEPAERLFARIRAERVDVGPAEKSRGPAVKRSA